MDTIDCAAAVGARPPLPIETMLSDLFSGKISMSDGADVIELLGRHLIVLSCLPCGLPSDTGPLARMRATPVDPIT